MSREIVELHRAEAAMVDDPNVRAAMLRMCDWQDRVDEAAERLPKPLPCPSWCTSCDPRYQVAAWDEPFTWSRCHEWDTDVAGCYIAQREQVDEYGIQSRDEPFARMTLDADTDLTAGDLRKIAALALNMADKLEEITR